MALGATDTEFAEVRWGLVPGDRVIAHFKSVPDETVASPDRDPVIELALAKALR